MDSCISVTTNAFRWIKSLTKSSLDCKCDVPKTERMLIHSSVHPCLHIYFPPRQMVGCIHCSMAAHWCKHNTLCSLDTRKSVKWLQKLLLSFSLDSECCLCPVSDQWGFTFNKYLFNQVNCQKNT